MVADSLSLAIRFDFIPQARYGSVEEKINSSPVIEK
jgi:hypothetical protein